MEVQSSVQEVLPDVGNEFNLDENVKQALPANCRFKNAIVYGTAAWTKAARIIVELEDGKEMSFFLKCATEDQGKLMIEGEYASLSAIVNHQPALAPKPYACGQFKESPVPTYFLLMEFLDIQTGAPDPALFCQQLAELHRNSTSPTGQFGFHMITCHGPHPQNTTWEDSWAVFFSRLLRQFFQREIDTNGHDKDYEALFDELEAVIPKILGPLQADGRHLKPCLVHGDLWEENAGTCLDESRQPKIFDAAVFYAHNEYELGMWRRDIIRFGRAHTRQYLRYMTPSEPKDQWDDRNRLYAIKFEIAHSIGWPATCQQQREIIAKDMRYLIVKYGGKGSQNGVADPPI